MRRDMKKMNCPEFDKQETQRMKKLFVLLALFISSAAWAGIPATPVMTLYRFNSALEIPYYDIETFRRAGPTVPAGTLPQGASLVPCLVVDSGRPLTDSQGVPYVGFQVVVDPRTATPAVAESYKKTLSERQSLTVANHHCDAGVKFVTDVRNLYAMGKAPFFDPPLPVKVNHAANQPRGELDQIIRTFHNSAYCDSANRHLIGRRSALQGAWDRFIHDYQSRWSDASLQRAKHLDYTMRTAIFEGHLERGCNAYGACERNIIALSIRNRGRESCSKRQGCGAPGDFQGVSTMVSQYNIWDEYLTQISGLTSCFLRDDLAGESNSGARNYSKLQNMYAQNFADVQRILFGSDQDLAVIFPNNSLADLKSLKHYYHAPAMGKCFPQYDRVEYMSGAVANKGKDFALIANTRIQVDQQTEGGYFFRNFVVQEDPVKDVIKIIDNYPGFVVDKTRISLKGVAGCSPYGIPSGCRFNEVGRYRKTPSWVNKGKPLELTCRAADRGEKCEGGETLKTAKVGGVCDTEMRPFAGVD
jgi:hypothetical protein